MQFTTIALAALAGFASGTWAWTKGGDDRWIGRPVLTNTTTAQKVSVVTVSTKNNSLVYTPDNIKAAVGEMIQFQFVGGNHTVTQSAFDAPCMPISMATPNVTGFHSGFMPVAASAATGMIPTYTVLVNNTTPTWIYCAQAKHCEQGMVMVINEK